MNDILTPIEKIDSVLNFMLSANNPPFITFSEILDSMQLQFKCEQKELAEILHTLEKDGHIFSEESNKIREYKSTFYGRMFALKGGYHGAISRQNDGNIRADKIERAQRDFRRTQNVLLILVALGTLIAALYYCVDLYWRHGWFHF